MKKSICLVLSVILLLALFSGCEKPQPEFIEAESYLRAYYDALKHGFANAHGYLYFGEYEFVREDIIQFPDKLVDYIIEDSQRINDNLYEFTVLTEFDTIHVGMYSRGFSFVGRIGDQVYVMMSIDYIPEELRENLDYEKYETFYTRTTPEEGRRAKEAKGKQIIQPGDIEYGLFA